MNKWACLLGNVSFIHKYCPHSQSALLNALSLRPEMPSFWMCSTTMSIYLHRGWNWYPVLLVPTLPQSRYRFSTYKYHVSNRMTRRYANLRLSGKSSPKKRTAPSRKKASSSNIKWTLPVSGSGTRPGGDTRISIVRKFPTSIVTLDSRVTWKEMKLYVHSRNTLRGRECRKAYENMCIHVFYAQALNPLKLLERSSRDLESQRISGKLSH